jgi:glycosyltransferase involved in cell wall biosynthesis
MVRNGLVSIVIPAHNAAKTIVRAVQSVLVQDYRPIEVVVVDDCSEDETGEIVEGYADRGVRLIKLDRCHGASGARNAGIAASRGEFVAFQDADDEWLPSKLTKQMAVLQSDERIIFVSCAANVISPEGVDLGDLYQGRLPATGGQVWRTLLLYNFIATPSVVVRRTALATAGGFSTALRVAEDQDMWLRLASLGHFGYVPDILLRVHMSPGGLSGNFDDQMRYTLPMIRRHIEAKREELTQREINAILGERLSRLGRVALWQSRYVDGAMLLGQALLRGHHPLDILLALVNWAPPVRWLKRWLRTKAA